MTVAARVAAATVLLIALALAVFGFGWPAAVGFVVWVLLGTTITLHALGVGWSDLR